MEVLGEKPVQVPLVHHNLTWISLHDEGLAPNRLGHGTARDLGGGSL